jgi:hypothetical protein
MARAEDTTVVIHPLADDRIRGQYPFSINKVRLD